MSGENVVLQYGLKCFQPIRLQHPLHQYLWKKSIDIFDLLHGDNHQEKVGSETTPFGWVWPVVHLV